MKIGDRVRFISGRNITKSGLIMDRMPDSSVLYDEEERFKVQILSFNPDHRPTLVSVWVDSSLIELDKKYYRELKLNELFNGGI